MPSSVLSFSLDWYIAMQIVCYTVVHLLAWETKGERKKRSTCWNDATLAD